MQEEEFKAPTYPKPWYYRPEYLIPMFFFWPSGSLLAIRSPWNQNVMFGGVAWAFLIVGAFAGFKWLQAGSYQPIATFFFPGILLTVVTQVQWAIYRGQMAENEAAAKAEPPGAELDDAPPRPSARRRRRNPRTGRSRN
ncbi:MAG: hypothetical protein O3A93_10220 [Chloroflexi bacterium]|nr:hypothetical protein [Chloroflexota bacterium]MDA1271618.1 hypothetical protein [Chloroflexota bacterium]